MEKKSFSFDLIKEQKAMFPIGSETDAPQRNPFIRGPSSDSSTVVPLGSPDEWQNPVSNPANERGPDRSPESDPGRNPAGGGDRDLNQYFRDKSAQMDFSSEFHRGSRSGGIGYKLVAWSFIAALIDGLILFSMACMFVLGFSFLVKSKLHSVLEIFGGSAYQIGAMAGALILLTYMIMLRVFLGFTIGEWACSLRLGNLKQRLNRFYSLRVVARMLAIVATGLVVLPAISLLIGRDLAGMLVRLPLIEVREPKK